MAAQISTKRQRSLSGKLWLKNFFFFFIKIQSKISDLFERILIFCWLIWNLNLISNKIWSISIWNFFNFFFFSNIFFRNFVNFLVFFTLHMFNLHRIFKTSSFISWETTTTTTSINIFNKKIHFCMVGRTIGTRQTSSNVSNDWIYA